jgi:hypothetical protein
VVKVSRADSAMQGVYRRRQQSGQKGCCGAMGETMFRMTKGMGTWTEGAQELLARANQRPHAVPRDINEPSDPGSRDIMIEYSLRADSVRRHPGTREMTKPLVLRWPVPLSRASVSCISPFLCHKRIWSLSGVTSDHNHPHLYNINYVMYSL